MSKTVPRIVCVVCALLLSAPLAMADGWPQFRGPNRDGISTAENLLTDWPESGPPELWRLPIGHSFAGIVVAGGRAFTMDSDENGEYAISFAVEDGKELWRQRVDEPFKNSFGDGSRTTPTLDGDRLFVLSGAGKLAALDTADGTVRYTIDLKKDFGAETPHFGFSTAPLIDGDRLFIEAGGPEGKSIVALDKVSGEVLWHKEDSLGAYSSPILIEMGGQKQLVFLTKDNVLGITPGGDVLWRHPFASEQGVKPAMPIFLEPDLIFVSASYDIGAMAVKVRSDEGKMIAEEQWQSRVMRNHFNSSVAIGKHIFGFDNATFKCIDGTSGETLWAKRGRLGKSSLIYAAGHLIVLSETGQLLLVKADPESYQEVASAEVLSGRCWTSPTLAGGRLFLRNREERVAIDLRPSAASSAPETQEGDD